MICIYRCNTLLCTLYIEQYSWVTTILGDNLAFHIFLASGTWSVSKFIHWFFSHWCPPLICFKLNSFLVQNCYCSFLKSWDWSTEPDKQCHTTPLSYSVLSPSPKFIGERDNARILDLFICIYKWLRFVIQEVLNSGNNNMTLLKLGRSATAAVPLSAQEVVGAPSTGNTKRRVLVSIHQFVLNIGFIVWFRCRRLVRNALSCSPPGPAAPLLPADRLSFPAARQVPVCLLLGSAAFL